MSLVIATCFAVAIMAGCGGGGNVSQSSAYAPQNTGKGKVTASVKFTGRAGGREADAASASTVNVNITISGVYAGDGKEFTPVSTVYPIDLSKGSGQAQLTEVPVGVNHLLTASVNWGNATETVMSLVPSVARDEVTAVIANEESTVVASTVIYIAKKQNIKLNEVKPDVISAVETAVHNYGQHAPYNTMTPESVLAYQSNMSNPGSVQISPASATVAVGASQQFTASVLDANNSPVTSATVRWAVTGTAGTISTTGLFTATATGSATITASTGSATGTAVVTITSAASTQPVCGNGAIESGEACDDGNTTTETCAYGQTSCTVCASTCQNAAGAVSGYCGDGTTQTSNGETCDSAASNGQPNQCNSTCNGTTGTTCGNGAVESGETCDDSNAVTETCAYGQTSCTVCNSTCQSATGTAAFCGDGVAQTGNGETCDDSNAVTETCAYGQTSCTVCNSTCQSAAGAVSGYCGDGTTQTANGETCDSGASNGQPNMCNSTCNGTTGSTCGNSVTESGETCDDGNTTTEVCAYGQTSCTICNSTCQSATGTVAFCGDGVTQAGNGETCDSAASNGQPNQCNSTCNGTTASVCGNSVTEAGEACDAGASNGQPSQCNSTCTGITGSTCGNSLIEAGETCDDGNAVTETCAYGQTSCTICNNLCQSASGTVAFCGDGATQAGNGETCDDSNTVTEVCAYGQTSCTVCNSTCQSAAGAVTGYCGDSLVQSSYSEICDSGASNGQPNMCSNTCTGLTASVCGNGVTESSETCDDSNAVTESCSYGQTSCTVCNNTCHSASGPLTGYCGDGTTQGANGEACDDNNTVTESCTYGQTSCTICNSTCQSAAGAVTGYCGDGTTQGGSGETCDDSNAVTESCSYGQTSCTICNNTCQSVAGAVTGYCGDSVVQGGNGETCDSGASNGQPAMCNNTCNGPAPAVCGNGTLEPGEECEDGNTANGDGCSQYCLSEIATAMEQVCAINKGYSGGAECWGRNDIGQLGDGTTTNRSVPTPVSGLTSGVKQIVMGNSFSCALTTAGGVKCWGYNGNGQLGNGNLTTQTSPVDVTGLSSGVKQISAGTGHVCAVMNTGGVKCWGWNNSAQVGNGGGADVSTPVDVPGVTDAAYVITGETFSCVLSGFGGIKCWGTNANGQLGSGSWGSSTTPVDVLGLTSGVAMISTGSVNSKLVCALTTAGGVKCWGENWYGGVGDGTGFDRNSPTDVVGLTSGMKGIGVGFLHACALTTSGAGKCWGNNAYGTLGDGTFTHSTVPVNVSLGGTIATIKASRTMTVARLSTGAIYIWGDNTYGQHGLGTTGVWSNVPVLSNQKPAGSISTDVSSGAPTLNVNFTGSCTDPDGTCASFVWNFGDGSPTASTQNTSHAYTSPGIYYATFTVTDNNGASMTSTATISVALNQVCGNGSIEPGEECDDSNVSNGDGCSQYCLSELAVGMEQVCAINRAFDGGAECWGRNDIGQIADGTTTHRYSPTPVLGLSSGVKQIVLGNSFGCVLTTAGGVKCWGYNGNGQVGIGNLTNQSTPMDVTGLSSGVKQISTGTGHVCAVMNTGGLKCWGLNNYGQVGNGGGADVSTPVDVPGLTNVAYVATGDNFTCVLTIHGGIKCWGRGNIGSLGAGDWGGSYTPVNVYGMTSGALMISTGSVNSQAICALTAAGGVKCWGENLSGGIGDGTNTDKNAPTDVVGLTSGMKSLGVGYLQSCALTTAGAAKCWGNNAYGTLGDGTNTHSNVPVNVSLGVPLSVVKGSRTLTGGRAANGDIYLWGDNSFGQHGRGSSGGASNVPVTFTVSKFSSNGSTNCVITAAGGLKCWGDNTYGQLGDGTTTNRSTPAFVSGLTSGVSSVSVGTTNHVCALTTAGAMLCWGNNPYGELGNGTLTASSIPVSVTGLGSGVSAFDTGFSHACALTTGGGLKCWGYNAYNELGDGTSTDRTTPVDVTGFTTGVSKVSGRAWHNCMVTTGGGVKCWGEGYGATPVDITGLTSGVQEVRSGYNSDCALTTAGGVKCWGYNGSGQLGNATNTNSVGVPVDVSGLTSGVTDITMTWRQACALLTTGGVKCWGENSNGQLGNGTTANSNVPVDVTGLTSGVTAIYTSGSSPGALTCAVHRGVLKCWGFNYYGQLGDGTTTQRLTPVSVLGF